MELLIKGIGENNISQGDIHEPLLLSISTFGCSISAISADL